MDNCQDVRVVRDLAKEYIEKASSPAQAGLRELWRKHNSFRGERPLIYVRAFAWQEMPQSECVCGEPLFRQVEDFFRKSIFLAGIGDDSILEPWITVSAEHKITGWGVDYKRNYSLEQRGAFKVDYPVKEPGDIEKLKMPFHIIDEAKTAEKLNMAEDALGDIITVNLDRAPAFRMWRGDISTDLGHLRGIENIMMDMVDRPGWLHRLSGFLSRGVLKTHDEAEAAGDWSLSAHQNQSMPYAEELPDPAPNVNGIKRSSLWGYMAAQEFTGVSPAMHEEFLLRYQLPMLKKFGLAAYGCCEDLTNKIDMLRKIPNLRRIAVSPFADLGRCAKAIGKDFILSYRPSPADMVSYSFDPDRIKSILTRDLQICRESHFDITLKDVQTVQCDEKRVKKWVALVREVIDDVF